MILSIASDQGFSGIISLVKPPYTINNRIVSLVAQIENVLGRISGLTASPKPNLELRRQNRIRSIQASLSIEGNSLDLDTVANILDGKKVLASKQEVQEVMNAMKAYDSLSELSSNSLRSLLKAHSLMMHGLIDNPGKYRDKNIGIYKGTKAVHFAPQPKMLPKLMEDLFKYLKADEDHPLIKSSVFHYEFEFIHPFSDGNGRMGRLWQTLILTEFNSIFEYLPIESLIKVKQNKYYQVLGACDKAGASTQFIEFMLGIILEVLEDYSREYKVTEMGFQERIAFAKVTFQDMEFSRKQYIDLLKTISTATASRDLIEAVKLKKLKKIGKNNQSKYKFN